MWDTFTHTYPQLIKDHSTGDVACDSYHLWREDVRILKETNVHFYRFSLSWSRILPTGFSNIVNPDGVRYYNNIIDELLNNNIEPVVSIVAEKFNILHCLIYVLHYYSARRRKIGDSYPCVNLSAL